MQPKRSRDQEGCGWCDKDLKKGFLSIHKKVKTKYGFIAYTNVYCNERCRKMYEAWADKEFSALFNL